MADTENAYTGCQADLSVSKIPHIFFSIVSFLLIPLHKHTINNLN